MKYIFCCKDVYSTNDLNKSVENSEKDNIDENEDDDDNYSELDDENLVFPDVSFKETDGEIVTQSDDEAIQVKYFSFVLFCLSFFFVLLFFSVLFCFVIITNIVLINMKKIDDNEFVFLIFLLENRCQ